MPALSNFITSITKTRYLPKVIDQVVGGNVLMTRLWNNKVQWNGGVSITVPVNLTARTNVGSYSGFDSWSTTQEDVRQNAVWTPSQVRATASISGIQKAVNKGEAAVVDVVAQEMKDIAEALRQELGTELYSDGSGNQNKDITGLQAAVDDSTGTITYAGLSRSAYTVWKATRTTQSGSLTLANLAADFDAAQVGDDAPTIFITTPAVFTIYEALLTPSVQHNLSFNGYDMVTAQGIQKSLPAAGNGFRCLYFRGLPLVADEKCTSGYLYTLNERHLFLYHLPQDPDMVESEYDGFGWTGWLMPVNQDAVTGTLKTYLQLICDSPRTQAKRISVTS